MTRTTKTEVHAVFERLCLSVGVANCEQMEERYIIDHDATGVRMGVTHKAGWSLDYAACYGGWTISGHSGEGTGESRPLGHARMPAREFVQAMQFAIQAIYSRGEIRGNRS